MGHFGRRHGRTAAQSVLNFTLYVAFNVIFLSLGEAKRVFFFFFDSPIRITLSASMTLPNHPSHFDFWSRSIGFDRDKLPLCFFWQPPCPAPARPAFTIAGAAPSLANPDDGSSSAGTWSPAADLLGDVPFALAPHVQAMQRGFSSIPDVPLAKDMNSRLTYFQYDFTLEKSVLRHS